MPKAKVIILNGTSSAGKSSIARYLQDALDEPFLHYQWDSFLNMEPKNRSDSPGLGDAFLKASAVFANVGHNLIIDTVCMGPWPQMFLDTLEDYDVFMVGVTASLETLASREAARGDREIGLAASQYDAVKAIDVYDLEVDTTDMTPQEAGDVIIKAFAEHLAPATMPLSKVPQAAQPSIFGPVAP